MISASFSPRLGKSSRIPSPGSPIQHRFGLPLDSRNKSQQFGLVRKSERVASLNCADVDLFPETASSSIPKSVSVSLAASIAVLLWSHPAEAGFLSGYSGIESARGPELPKFEFLDRFNEENQKRYAELDARFKESPLLKQLLEKSKQNKEKNKQSILDKYCIRGAEWGVGDCSAEGMRPEEREKFIAMLKEKAGIKD